MASTPPGQRKLQILQALAAMLEQPKGEKITTAALAARLSVSEAALYRHFASKAQMFEGLIEFIEASVFGLINQIAEKQPDGLMQARDMTGMLLNFASSNPGMTRVLIGDALVNEDERLQLRMNQFYDRIELVEQRRPVGGIVAAQRRHMAGIEARTRRIEIGAIGGIAGVVEQRITRMVHDGSVSRRFKSPAAARSAVRRPASDWP